VSSLAQLLAAYGGYHRDPRNRLTHYAGVPMIIYAALIPAALQVNTILGRSVSLDQIVVALLVLWYLCLDVRLGLILAVILGLLCWAAEVTTSLGTYRALTVAGTIFVLGWVLQFYGHHLERNRPAFFTNVGQMVVAPIYLVAELAFALGLRRNLRADIESRFRPTHT
jgi:uncharacterized membrane protein YGL010W